MSREWKPGDVALVRVSEEYAPEVAVSGDRQWYVAGPRLGSRHGWYHANVEVIRPLVVIDPEDAEQVERFVSAYFAAFWAMPGAGAVVNTSGQGDHIPEAIHHDAMRAALREFARPTPPKPDEPQGLGAVVEDAEGEWWVRCVEAEGGWHWYRKGKAKQYDDIPAVRVLSEGVQA